ncbi:GNAT family N-acetyltransferase [Ideonella azotifigens]|nr:GNAT family N-acetyltransferase [Ideonella azotifigens]MCD2342739.1 GNAT family N-acetyltransferase [Ideonella azotifigens]
MNTGSQLHGDAVSGVDEILGDGTHVRVRPIHPDDLELERRFIEALSPASRYFRFMETLRSPSDALLKQMTVIDPATDAAYVAVVGEGDQQREVGVARFSARADGQDCEFAVTVSDEWQQKGLGSLLMARLIEVARARGIGAMHSSDAADNSRMRQFADHLHFQHKTDPDDPTMVRYTVDLKANSLPAAGMAVAAKVLP